MAYTITAKGRTVLRSAALWGLSGHVRDLLLLCDPQVRLEHARQCFPPASLQQALSCLLELELIAACTPAGEPAGNRAAPAREAQRA